jgi:glycosyltransferase involved in cell wall biosynthesis
MKVAIFVHCFFPDHFYGTETYTLNIASNLRSLGHSVTVIAAQFHGEPAKAQSISSYTFEGIDVVLLDKNYYPHHRVRDTYYQAEIKNSLYSILKSQNPDVIHVTHLINHTAVLLDVARELNIPTVATLTDFFGFCFTNKLEDARGLLCTGPSRDRSNCLACYLKVAGSEHMNHPLLSWFRRHLPLNLFSHLLIIANRIKILPVRELTHLVQDLQERPKLLTMLYNSTYRTTIAPTSFLAKAYQNNGLTVPTRTLWFGVDIDRSPKPVRPSSAPLRIGYIGQLAEHKGIDLLLDAFNRLNPCSAEVLIYGPLNQDPAYAARLKELANPQVQFRATFAPEKMAEVMTELDLLVIPSRWYENSPLVLLYALATHTPVIVSRVEGLTEFLQEGVNGFSFERGSSSDLERVLQEFMTDKSLAARLSTTTNYNRDTRLMASEVIEVYESACRE